MPQAIQDKQAYIEFCQRIMNEIKHSLKLKIIVDDAADSRCILKMPLQEGVVGDTRTNAMHGGAVFSLVDQACGLAVFCATYPNVRIAPTLDLRIDHMRKTRIQNEGEFLYADAHCYRLTDNVAFTRAVMHEGDVNDPVAHVVGSYMVLEGGKEKGWLS